MKSILTIFILLLLFANYSYAQEVNVKGILLDSITKQKLDKGVIYLLRASDSIILKYTRIKSDGSFEFKDIAPNNFILIASLSNYIEYEDRFDIRKDTTIDLGYIRMVSKVQLLSEVIVKGGIRAIIRNGDTTEYRADSFYVAPNATVEDLLKKLPGVRVNKKGEITAQGEKVKLILVDGEEFFSDDPTLVTRNLTANMVSKVQVYDKKTEQSKALGIDDGKNIKVINLKLKEDKKSGYFGRALGSVGTNQFYDNLITLNHFRGKRKLGVYSIISNTGKLGLNSTETETFISNDQNNIGRLDTWDGQFSGRGLPILQTVGAHYSNKWNDAKESLILNYKFRNLRIRGIDSSFTEFILPDTSYFTKENKSFSNKILSNKISGAYEKQIDSTSSIKITFNGEMAEKESDYDFRELTMSSKKEKLNFGSRTISTLGKLNNLNSSFSWIKILSKRRRKILFDINEGYTSDISKANLYSENSFYKIGSNLPFQVQITDQLKTNKHSTLLLGSKLTYVEPVSKNAFILFNFSITSINSSSTINSFNKNTTGEYLQFDSIFSSNFKFSNNLPKYGIGYSVTKNRYYLISGIDIGKANLTQKDFLFNSQVKKSYINWFPQIRFSYKIAARKRVTFRYDGNSINPTIDQIQSGRLNNEPLNVFLGNAKLVPSFSNSIKIVYSDSKSKNERDLVIRIIYDFIKNDFSYNTTLDSFGRTEYKYENVNGVRGFSQNIEYRYLIPKTNIYIDFNVTSKQKRNVNIINNKTNNIVLNSQDFTLSLSKSIDKKCDFGLEFHFDNITTAGITSISRSRIRNSIYSFSPVVDFFLPRKLQLHSDCDFTFRSTNIGFAKSNNIVLWNIWFEKSIFKNSELKFRLGVNDLLNNNNGFNLNANKNSFTQNEYNVIRRYGNISVIWNFTKNK